MFVIIGAQNEINFLETVEILGNSLNFFIGGVGYHIFPVKCRVFPTFPQL